MFAGKNKTIEKLATGIPGFDHISVGGIPRGRTTLVSGTAGSAKTVLAVQFLVEGIRMNDEPGVFVTFEESPEDIRRNMLGFGWDIEKLEAEGKWAFVDASEQADMETVEAGAYDLGALIARIEHAVNKVEAQRLSMDSLGAIFGQLSARDIVRKEMHRLGYRLQADGDHGHHHLGADRGVRGNRPFRGGGVRGR